MRDRAETDSKTIAFPEGDEIRMIRAARILLDEKLRPAIALIPSICGRNAPGSRFAGKANALIFPDLNAGSIGYKPVLRFGRPEVYGPFLQRFRKPMSDLSRGYNSADVVITSVVTLVQGLGEK